MSTVMAADYAGLIEPLARHFWSEPNEQLSKPADLRFGAHGSKSVDLQKSSFLTLKPATAGVPSNWSRAVPETKREVRPASGWGKTDSLERATTKFQ